MRILGIFLLTFFLVSTLPFDSNNIMAPLPSRLQSVSSFFKPISQPEYQQQCEVDFRAIKVDLEAQERLQHSKLDSVKARRRIQNQANQQATRERRRAREVLQGKRDRFTGKLLRPALLQPQRPPPRRNLPNLTHPGAHQRERGKYKHQSRKRSDWLKESTWSRIDEAAQLHDFKDRAIVRYLQSRHRGDGYFDSLLPGTVQRWIQKGEKRWKDRILESVEAGTTWKAGKGRVPLLAQYPGTKPGHTTPPVNKRKLIRYIRCARFDSTFFTWYEACQTPSKLAYCTAYMLRFCTAISSAVASRPI